MSHQVLQSDQIDVVSLLEEVGGTFGGIDVESVFVLFVTHTNLTFEGIGVDFVLCPFFHQTWEEVDQDSLCELQKGQSIEIWTSIHSQTLFS